MRLATLKVILGCLVKQVKSLGGERDKNPPSAHSIYVAGEVVGGGAEECQPEGLHSVPQSYE